MTPTTNFNAFSGMRPSGCRTRTAAITTRMKAASAPAAAASSVSLDAEPTVSSVELVLNQGRRLRVWPGFDADMLRELVRLLEEPAC